jgi:hypothetical protein
MNNHIDDFLAREHKGNGKLGPWLDDIIKLRARGAPYRAICRYLAECGVTARAAEVHVFVHRRGREKLIASRTTAPAHKPASPAVSIGPDGLPEFKWNPRGDPNSKW